ncbi:MAG: hypothetical protein QOF21_992 [Actinomycetota bacterium]|jgi:integrase/recombinase XerC
MHRTSAGPTVDLIGAVALAGKIIEREWVSLAQATRVSVVLERFRLFCERGHRVTRVDDVTADIAASFVRAATADGELPTASLMHFRRNALRLLFRSLRRTGADIGDPTLDLDLPRRSPVGARPLVDDEVLLCRGVSQWSLNDSRRATAWALAEASARSGELPFLRAGDVDLEQGRVWLHGGKKTAERWGHLTEWGQCQLERRLHLIAWDVDRPLVYDGRDRSDAGQVSACVALFDIFERAGLQSDPGVRPASIAAWAGRQVLVETGRIEEVARRLGIARLDRAARFIDWSWQDGDPRDV